MINLNGEEMDPLDGAVALINPSGVTEEHIGIAC